MRKLAVRLVRTPTESLLVGHLAELNRRLYFEYAPEFAGLGLQLSPFKLPLRTGAIEHTDSAFGPLPGLFDDSLPDVWGLLLMDRALRRTGVDPRTVSPLERLAWLGTRTMGALTYHPPHEMESTDRALDLARLAANARAVLAGEASEVLPELIRAGGSPGGTRPKVLVGLCGNRVLSGEDDLPADYEHWLVKFPARQDARDAGPMEYAYARMAQAAGIDMPEVRLLTGSRNARFFAIRRFDRAPGNRRRHVHTFGNLIHADYRVPGCDYADLLKVAAALTRNHKDVVQAFRRMVFNVAAHNRDDHAKNFAFLMDDDGQWFLSPAYDITFAPGPGGEHTTTILGEGRSPTADHCLQLAAQAGLQRNEAVDVLDEVNAAVCQWPRLAAEAGCTRRTIHETGGRLIPL